MSDFKPIVNQLIHEQPFQRFEAPRLLYAALEWISKELKFVLWNRMQREVANPFHKDQRTRFETEGLAIHGCDRDDPDQHWNLKCDDLEISWYRHSWCCVSVNREMTNDDIAAFLDRAVSILDSCNMDMDYHGSGGEQPFTLDGEEIGESSYQRACREEREAHNGGRHD